MEQLAASDFVFLTGAGHASGFPFDETMTRMAPRMRAWCDERLRYVTAFPLFGRTVLYERREISPARGNEPAVEVTGM